MTGGSGVTAVGSTYNDASFENIKFMVTSAPTATTITVTMATTESGTQLRKLQPGQEPDWAPLSP